MRERYQQRLDYLDRQYLEQRRVLAETFTDAQLHQAYAWAKGVSVEWEGTAMGEHFGLEAEIYEAEFLRRKLKAAD